jgi:hypothetical protein
MTDAVNGRDVKAKARALDPTWDSEDRITRRQQTREQMLAAVSGAQLAEIRQQRLPVGSGLGEALEGADRHIRPGGVPERG